MYCKLCRKELIKPKIKGCNLECESCWRKYGTGYICWGANDAKGIKYDLCRSCYEKIIKEVNELC